MSIISGTNLDRKRWGPSVFSVAKHQVFGSRHHEDSCGEPAQSGSERELPPGLFRFQTHTRAPLMRAQWCSSRRNTWEGYMYRKSSSNICLRCCPESYLSASHRHIPGPWNCSPARLKSPLVCVDE